MTSPLQHIHQRKGYSNWFAIYVLASVDDQCLLKGLDPRIAVIKTSTQFSLIQLRDLLFMNC